jgi:hypothetical protein
MRRKHRKQEDKSPYHTVAAKGYSDGLSLMGYQIKRENFHKEKEKEFVEK